MSRISEFQNLVNLYNLSCSQISLANFHYGAQIFKCLIPQLLEKKDFIRYVHSQASLMSIHMEMESLNESDQIHQELESFIDSHQDLKDFDIIGYPQARYAIALCLVQKKNYHQAIEILTESIEHIIKVRKNLDREDVDKDFSLKNLILEIAAGYAYYLLGVIYYINNKNLSCIKMVKSLHSTNHKLDQILSKIKSGNCVESKASLFLEYKDIFITQQSSLIIYENFINGVLLMREQKYKGSEKLLWVCYEKIQQGHHPKFFYLYILYYLAKICVKTHKYQKAQDLLMLLEKSTNPFLKRFNKMVTKAKSELKINLNKNKHDIVIRYKNKTIETKYKGVVNFKNQFMLLDIFKLLATNKGVVFSKEKLVHEIWETQDYNPLIHDNKVYVTIKRLRNLVEPNKNKPKYIFRSKDGYYIRDDLNIAFK